MKQMMKYSVDMIVFLLTAYFLLGRISALPEADKYMDSVIGEPLEKAIQDMNLDPAPLPDFTIPFQYNFGPVPITGRFDYFNGFFRGLSKIRRLSECDGPTVNLNEIKIECLLNLFGMSTVYDSRVQIEQLPPIPYQITAYVNETHVKNGFGAKLTNLKPDIKVFEITKFGDINVRLSGLGMLQYIYNAVEEQFKERIREELIKIIIQQYPLAFKIAMSQVLFPKAG